jgi:hypothetical protein
VLPTGKNIHALDPQSIPTQVRLVISGGINLPVLSCNHRSIIVAVAVAQRGL